jgi:hypothetical protein
MAKLQWMRDRVENWAAWRVRRNSGGVGRYAAMTYEDPAQRGTDPYADAPVKPHEEDAWEIDAAMRVVLVSTELRATIECHYLSRYTEAEKLRRLCVAKSTLHDRLDRVDRLLVRYFSDRHAQAAQERARVEALQASVRSA